MGSRHVAAVCCASLAILLAGGCVFDSMGIPKSSPPDGPRPHVEGLIDLQPNDLEPTDHLREAQAPDTSAPPGDGTPDQNLTDTKLPPDQYVKPPDLGCPGGKSPCGSKCLDLNKDINNCGKCGKKCDAKAADGCQSGLCVCGTSGAECPAGLNCQKGKCLCVTGPSSRCNGCCKGISCYLPGVTGGQNHTRCGKKGTACKSCDDNETCTVDSCSTVGVCTHKNEPANKTCNDNNKCTPIDKCVKGKCKGTPMDCTHLDIGCNTGVCNTLWGTCEGKPKPPYTPCQTDFGPCLQKGKCHCVGGNCISK